MYPVDTIGDVIPGPLPPPTLNPCQAEAAALAANLPAAELAYHKDRCAKWLRIPADARACPPCPPLAQRDLHALGASGRGPLGLTWTTTLIVGSAVTAAALYMWPGYRAWEKRGGAERRIGASAVTAGAFLVLMYAAIAADRKPAAP